MNLIKFFKSGLASLLVLIIGLVLLFTVNFNKSFDFTGGTVITVNITNIEVNEAMGDINEVLSENGIKASYISMGENQTGTCIIIKYQIFENQDTVNNNVENDLFEKFGYDKNDAMEANFIIMQTNTMPEFGVEIFTKAFLAVLISIIAAAIYMFARHNLTSGFTMIAIAILDLGIMIALTLIARVPINQYFGIVIMSTAVFSMYFSFMNLNTFNKNAKDEQFVKYSNKELVNLFVKDEFKRSAFIGLAVIITLIILSIWINDIGFASISLILGILACIFSSYFITPTLWALAFNRKFKKAKKVSSGEAKEKQPTNKKEQPIE